jgi:DNA-binding XRE family transcriptional regulator
VDNHTFLLATRDERVISDFRQVSPGAVTLDTAAVRLPVQINDIFTRRGRHIEVLIVDLTLPVPDINRLVFYIRQYKKDVPVVLLQLDRKRAMPQEKELFRNLSVYGLVRKPSGKAECAEVLKDLDDLLDLDRDKKFERVEYLEQEKTFACAFKNGKAYFLGRDLIAEDDGSKVEGIALSKDAYHFSVRLQTGASYEIPWDFVLYHCEEKYQFYAANGGPRTSARAIGGRVKDARKRRHLTQLALEKKTGILRANIARIESGRHGPSLETLEKLAGALRVPVYTLLDF